MKNILLNLKIISEEYLNSQKKCDQVIQDKTSVYMNNYLFTDL